MPSAFAKSNGVKSRLRIRWPKSSGFGVKSDDSTHRTIKGPYWSSKNLSRARQVQQQYEEYTKVRVAIDELDYEYNHDARAQSACFSADKSTASCRSTRAWTREEEESTHSDAAHRAGLVRLVEKMTT